LLPEACRCPTASTKASRRGLLCLSEATDGRLLAKATANDRLLMLLLAESADLLAEAARPTTHCTKAASCSLLSLSEPAGCCLLTEAAPNAGLLLLLLLYLLLTESSGLLTEAAGLCTKTAGLLRLRLTESTRYRLLLLLLKEPSCSCLRSLAEPACLLLLWLTKAARLLAEAAGLLLLRLAKPTRLLPEPTDAGTLAKHVRLQLLLRLRLRLPKPTDLLSRLSPKSSGLMGLLPKQAPLLLRLAKPADLLMVLLRLRLSESGLLWGTHLPKAATRGRLIKSTQLTLIKAAAKSVHLRLDCFFGFASLFRRRQCRTRKRHSSPRNKKKEAKRERGDPHGREKKRGETHETAQRRVQREHGRSTKREVNKVFVLFGCLWRKVACRKMHLGTFCGVLERFGR
jgi:hypothetical protein